jgi:integrase/recombinase XerC
MDLRDVDNAPVLWVRQGKGGKDRVVPVLDEVAKAIHAYLLETERLVTDPGPLFLREDRAVGNNNLTARLGDAGIRRILSKVGRRALITQKTSPHVLRHTFGLEFQRRSQDMNLTAKVLGHALLRTTKDIVDRIEIAELRAHIPSWES